MNLTLPNIGDYPFAQVILTPKLKRHIASDNVIFLRPLFSSMVGREANITAAIAANMPADFSRLEAPDHPHIADGQLPSKELKIMTELTILSTGIRQHDDLYSLNDLHKASGGEDKHRPTYFLRNEQTQELIAELSCADLHIIPTKTIRGRGKQQGTYACRELFIAYAAWISAAFHLKVIRVFLNQAKPELLQIPQQFITAAQSGELATLIKERFPDGVDRAYAWSRFNKHFRIARYRELPAGQFVEACRYIPSMPEKNEVKALPSPELTIKPPVWNKPGKANDIDAAQEIICNLKEWSATELPKETCRQLWDALDDLDKILTAGWTQVHESLWCISRAVAHLDRWNGKKAKISKSN